MSRKLSVLFVGDEGTGKTTVIDRFCSGEFDETILTTIGFQYKEKKYPSGNKIEMWDISGNRKYNWLVKQYLPVVDAVVLTCDMINKQSIYNLKYYWYDLITSNLPNKKILLYIFVNKTDHINKKFMYEAKMALKTLPDIKNMFFISALNGHNIHNAFVKIILSSAKQDNSWTQNCIIL